MLPVSSKTLSKASIELACLLVVAVMFVACGKVLVGYSFRNDGFPYYRFFDIGVSCLPGVFVYALHRLLLSPVASAVSVSLLILALSYASHVKASLTGEPLSWTDVSGSANISIVIHYVSLHLALAGCVALSLLVGLFVRFEWPLLARRLTLYRKRYIALAVLIALASGASFRETAADALPYAGYHIFEALGAKYDAFQWQKNVERNGLGIHLLHTSLRHMPPEPTASEEELFQTLSTTGNASADRPRTVVMILCESCWYDGRHFGDMFKPLVQRGFTPFRGIAPTYGGGTVNSAFEMITGLPARSEVLTGVIYQEYAPVISDDAYALPRYLGHGGFHTVAMHNNLGRFWHRNVVSPKMGFDEFHDIEDMGVKPSIEWADDSILFSSALREIDANKGKPIFLHLTTVFTHGQYERRGDLGEGHYREKLRKSISSMAAFIDGLQARDPTALVLVYGDHKPQLTSFFVREGVLSVGLFETTGEYDTDFRFADDADRKVIGDMPMWIMGPNKSKVQKFIRMADARPFFCVATFFDRVFLSSGLPAFKFGNPVCEDYHWQGYEGTVGKYPSWLFSKSILK